MATRCMQSRNGNRLSTSPAASNRPSTGSSTATETSSSSTPATSPTNPAPDLSPSDAQSEWDKAIQYLRRDGARPKETPHGVLMATSLAHFRSDYTIVHIPDGNYLAVRDQLYTNINLLRMGCSGRSALTLEPPSDATKSRFISTYHLPDSFSSHLTSTESLALTKSRSHSYSQSTSVLTFTKYASPHISPSSLSKARPPIRLGLPPSLGPSLGPPDPRPPAPKKTPPKDNSLFIATVLELVKLVQAGLAIFGMYPSAPARLDGLLCNQTVDAIRRWILSVGEPCVGLEPMERIADPMFVAALLSLVLSMRNKLAALGFSNASPLLLVVPKDPFLQPQIFTSALTIYVQSCNPATPPTIHRDPTFLTPNSSQNHSTHSHSQGHSFGSPQSGHVFPAYLQHLLPPPHHSSPPALHQLSPSSSSGSSASQSHSQAPAHAMLTRELVETINAAYDAKVRAGDGRVAGHGVRMRKAIREKLRPGPGVESDGDMGGGATSGGEGGGGGIGTGGGGGIERESGVGAGVASSGGQILSGIGNFASGLGLGVGAGGSGAATGAGALLEPTCNTAWLVTSIYGKDSKIKARKTMTMGKDRRGKERRGDPGDLGVGYAYAAREKERDGSIGASVRALWSGRVMDLVKMREWEVEKEKMEMPLAGPVAERKRERAGGKERDRWALSDGDVDDAAAAAAKSETEEESDTAIQGGGFAGIWRVQRKLESWTGIGARKRGHMSADLTSPSSRGDKDLSLVSKHNSLPEGLSTAHNLRPSPFSLLHDGRSLESTSFTTNTEYERKVTEFNQKRPRAGRVSQSRVSSWADPVSARSILDEESSDVDSSSRPPRRKRGDTAGSGSWLGVTNVVNEEPDEISEEEEGAWFEDDAGKWSKLRMEMLGPRRRRSFHDLDSLRGMRVLTQERMRVDVELCAQLLIMVRREQHLHNVVACLHVLTSRLAATNTLLRSDYQTHLPFLSNLEEHTQVISEIDAQNARADKTSQATHTLRYEAEQFRIPDLWHTATPPRQKVLELREKVFGTGGRRLPPGVRGAHGRFNRLQWTLDGRERLVDHLGRTESEAEEEAPGIPFLGVQEEDEEDVVEHSGIKPMWLLRFFTSWGARWGTQSAAAAVPSEDDSGGAAPDVPLVEGKESSDQDISKDVTDKEDSHSLISSS
ncbi:hypothetical protein H0H81_004962 [Sphagnurus paluster]|uniref:STB6-like N-terminal domain-containing protein n=1 Tax=Sphagnurus paluster TaxID=117069 RepID=A0A9P7KHB9_9AGAR|nr:hypothetical protein H0H81_004962 [Sphagnurus paluster]